jgi:DNA replication protein DnaD
MFMFDVETLGKESNSVILSLAAIYFDSATKPSPQELRDSAFFVKFNVEDQIKRLNRKVGKTTMQWWAKQCDNVRKTSFDVSPSDVIFEDGYEKLRQWAESKNDKKCYVWARGNLDQLIIDSFEEQLEIQPIWPFQRWRDVRTAIDILYNTNRGYCKVDYLGFDPTLHITKHNPTDDCVYDIMQLIYGKEE